MDFDGEVAREADRDSGFLNESSLGIEFGGGDPEVPMQVELSDIEKSIQASEEVREDAPNKEASEQNLEDLLRECLQADDPTPPLDDSKRRIYKFTKPILTRAEIEACRPREDEVNVVRKEKVDMSVKPSSKSTQSASEMEHRRRTQEVEVESVEVVAQGWNCGVCVTESQGQSGRRSLCQLF